VKELAIIGAGSWGTALAIALSTRFETIRLWIYEADLAERVAATRQNDVYLPGFTLPDNIRITTSLNEAASGASIVLGVVPSQHARRTYKQLSPTLNASQIFVSATKGLESHTLMRISCVIQQATGLTQLAVLSGPTFAREVAAGEPAALVIATENRELGRTVQNAFSTRLFRLYTNSDPIGVEIGAALKNVIAIGAGVCQGLGLGNNTMAALITRGLAEITRLAVSLGGEARTLAGLAGLGDLVLTCTGDLSRNRRVGAELARGRKLEDIVNSMRMVAEGIETTAAAIELAQRHRVDMPITEQMNAMLFMGRPPLEAIRELMERALKEE
jgi:glycerol-3-phosphate dehydrogenase (NAD(P)+)